MHRDAKRAVVGRRLIGVDVRHLRNRKQRQQHKTQNRNHAHSTSRCEPCPCAVTHPDLGPESFQNDSNSKNTRNWTQIHKKRFDPGFQPRTGPTHYRPVRLNCVR